MAPTLLRKAVTLTSVPKYDPDSPLFDVDCMLAILEWENPTQSQRDTLAALARDYWILGRNDALGAVSAFATPPPSADETFRPENGPTLRAVKR